MHGFAFFQFALHTLESAGRSLPAEWRALSQPAAALVLTAVWQGAAVALGLALCLRLAPRSPARHRFALWAAGFSTLLGLQILPLVSHLVPLHLEAVAGSALSAAASAAAPHPWLRLNAATCLLIASLWLIASLYRAADLAVHSLQLRKLWQSATPVEIDPASLPRSSSRASRRTLQICTTSQLERPSVIGFFAPRIFIPEWLFSRLTPGELDQIVLHETEHLRRRDDWTNLLQKLCLVLFPLNPGLAWIERRLCREREMACDDGVIHITRAPRAYAACLASLAERGLQRRAGALSLGAWHARPELVRRVHRILRRKHALNPAAARAVLAAVGCLLLAGATALARCPRLIAFVPAHRDAASTLLLQPHSTIADSHPVASHRASTKSGTVELARAEVAARPSVIRRHRIAAKNLSVLSTDVAAPQLASLAGDNNAFRPAPLVAPVPRYQSAFIVMSAWESVEIPNAETNRKAAPDKSARRDDARVSGNCGASAAQQVSPRISVTRMYLKIYTGGRESAWLVIQL